MRKLLVVCLTLLLLVPDINGKSFPQISSTQYTEFVKVQVKYSVKKTGIQSHAYIDIGTSKKHSFSDALEDVGDGVIKVGFGKDVAVPNNEVDMLNNFSGHGWVVQNVPNLKMISTSYIQYLFSKVTPE